MGQFSETILSGHVGTGETGFLLNLYVVVVLQLGRKAAGLLRGAEVEWTPPRLAPLAPTHSATWPCACAL